MKQHTIKNIDNTRFEFNTKSKKTIMDRFNHRSKRFHKIEANELIIINDKMCFPIDLFQWKDIDMDTDFINVLEILKRVTDPKGGNPLLHVLNATLVGYDKDKKQQFTFSGAFVNGKHVVIGNYEDGTKLLYTDILYLI